MRVGSSSECGRLGRRVLALLVENVNGFAVGVGAWLLYSGIRAFSPAAADVVAGVILMAIGAFPYLTRRQRKS